MNRFRTFAAILALSAAWPSPASAGHVCALWDLYTTNVNGTDYTTYYCDHYQDACNDSPDSATEYTQPYMEAPVWPCDMEVCEPVDGVKMKGGSPMPAGDDSKALETKADTKPTGGQDSAKPVQNDADRIQAPGLGYKVSSRTYKHQFPGPHGLLVQSVGQPRVVKIMPANGRGAPFHALEQRYRIPVPKRDGSFGMKPRDFLIAFETDTDLGGADDVYGDDETEKVTQQPTSPKVFAIDTGKTYNGPEKTKMKKTVLVLRS